MQPTSPKSYSGIAHRPGGGLMVTLGLWRSDTGANDQVGSVQTQSGTLLHELGHNLGLGHAGLNTQPNCLPNYPSVMNYAYQTRGLTDSAGNEHIDYSFGLLLPLSESLLTQIPMGFQAYRARFFGPLAPGQPSAQAAQVHCDGTPIKGGEPSEVRLEGPAVSTPDWSNGTNNWKTKPIFAGDVNYDGVKGQLFTDTPDWLILNLQQIGTGYTFGGLSVGALATDGGVFATDGGVFATDAGALATDGGVFATDGGAFATDGGAFATDGGVFATDGGALATDGGALATDAGEIDQNTLILSGAPQVPSGTFTATNTVSSIVLNWQPPDTGTADHYNVYRCAIVSPATTCTPSLFKPAPGGTATPTFTDTVYDTVDAGSTCPPSSTCYNTKYLYYVTLVAVVGTNPPAESGPSNTATSEVTHLFVIADNQAAVYGNANPTPTFHVYGDVSSSLPAANVTCVYAPAIPRNAGNYPVVCSGPAIATPLATTDGVTYNAAYLTYTPGSLTISALPVTVAAVASSKYYDGTVISTSVPTQTLAGALPYGDTLGLSEIYDNPNVGNAHVMTPVVAAGPGTLLTNYQITAMVNIGMILQAPLTITANNINIVYGTTYTFAGTEFTTSMLYGSDSVTSVTLTSAGSASNVAAGAYPITPSAAVGSGLANYAVSYANGTMTVAFSIFTSVTGTVTISPLGASSTSAVNGNPPSFGFCIGPNADNCHSSGMFGSVSVTSTQVTVNFVGSTDTAGGTVANTFVVQISGFNSITNVSLGSTLNSFTAGSFGFTSFTPNSITFTGTTSTPGTFDAVNGNGGVTFTFNIS